MKTTADQRRPLPHHAHLVDPGARPDATIVDRARTAGSRAAVEQAVMALPSLSVSSAAEADLVLAGALGVGGMGVVQVAHQRALSREVAVKRPRSDDGLKAIAISSLIEEARIQGALEHPNVVPIHALGRDAADLPVLVMKRLSGVSWRALIRDPDHPAWPEEASDRLAFHLETLMQVCNAVHFAHSRGVIHRDIKPSNVMVGAFGEVYLLDWGIAHCPRPDEPTGPGDPGIVGTPAYLAPEMLLGTGPHLSPRTDVYLLGATLHEVLTGQVRHMGETVLDMLYDASASEPIEYPRSVPAELAALCNRAMQRDPAARPESALAFRQAIAEFLRHRGSIALADAAAARLAELRRHGEGAAARGSESDLLIRSLFSEASFGFRQALLAWEGTSAAREGLAEALTWMTRYELSRRNPEAAAALLAELPAAPADLWEQVKAQRAELAQERAELTRLRSVARDIDASVAFRPRLWSQLGLSIFIGSCFFGLDVLRPEGPAHAELIITYGVSAALVGAVLLAFKGVLLVTRISWHIWTAVMLLLTGPALNHLLAQLLGLPVKAALAGGLLVDAAIGGMYASSTSWALWPLPTGFLIGALLTALFQEHAVLLAASTIVVTSWVTGFFAGRKLREQERTSASYPPPRPRRPVA